MKKTFTIILLSLSTILTTAQENGENKLGSWHMYFGTNRISEKLSIHTEAQLRYFENGKNFNQLLLRTGLNYHINPDAIATIGYGNITTDGSFEELSGEKNSREHRLFEQFILKNQVGKFAFEHRYRLEQRFITSWNPLPSDISRSSTEHRARYRLQVTLPLSKVVFLNFYDEIFLNLQNSVFGQNRLYGAIGFHVFKNTSVQVGYLKNHFATAHYDRLQIGVVFNPDLRKKAKD
ncbi:MAG: DUF2490 domain-containing protein [Flavobacteriaceae bacterium]